MKTIIQKIKIKTSVGIFLLFSGIAAFEIYRTRSLFNAAFWVAVAIMFLIVGNMTREEQKMKHLPHD